MLQVTARDSKKHNRSLQINGFVKPSGIVCASVTTDKGAQYFVVIKATKSTCTCEGNRTWGRQCYHIREVKALTFPKFDEINLYSVSEAVADADTQVRINEQNELVANDKTYAQVVQERAEDAGYIGDPRIEVHTHGYGCCGHIVKSEHDGQLCGACMCK